MYVDNLGILGTSRVNVDKNLRIAVQTLRSRGLDTHEEIVHSDTAIALGIHMNLRSMLVRWRLKQGLRCAPRCRALPGKIWEVLWEADDFCGPAQTGRAQYAFCAQ